MIVRRGRTRLRRRPPGGCAIGGVSIGHVMRTIWPFYGALIVSLMVVTYVPAFSLWLPQMFGYIPR